MANKGFSGLRGFVARKRGRYKLIGNRFIIPHDTIPSTLGGIIKPTDRKGFEKNNFSDYLGHCQPKCVWTVK